MALPKLQTPTYTMVIPSTQKEIKYRPFLVKEEKILLMALETDDEKNIRESIYELLKSCITTRIKLENLATFDLEYIFLNIRAVSVGEIVEMNVVCNDDEETNVRYNLNLTDVNVVFPEGHSNKIMLTDSTGVVMKYPSMDGFVQGQFSNKDFDVIDVIASSIDQIFQEEEVYDESTTTKKEFVQFVESLTNSQLEKIQAFFETSPRLEHTFKVTNPNTGVESEYTLRGLQSFFG